MSDTLIVAQNIAYSYHNAANDVTVKPKTPLSPEDFHKFLAAPRERPSAEDRAGFCPCTFTGTKRLEKNATAITLLGMDFDDNDNIQDLLNTEFLGKRLGDYYLTWHTTYKHQTGDYGNRYRIILYLDTPYPVRCNKAIRLYVEHVFPTCDKQTKGAVGLWFLPVNGENGEPCQVVENKGEILETQVLINAAGEYVKTIAESKPRTTVVDVEFSDDDAGVVLQNIAKLLRNSMKQNKKGFNGICYKTTLTAVEAMRRFNVDWDEFKSTWERIMIDTARALGRPADGPDAFPDEHDKLDDMIDRALAADTPPMTDAKLAEFLPKRLVENMTDAEYIRSEGIGMHKAALCCWNYRTNSKLEKSVLQDFLPLERKNTSWVGREGMVYEETTDFWAARPHLQLPIEATVSDAGYPYGIFQDRDDDLYYWNNFKDTRIEPVQGPKAYYDAFEKHMAIMIPDAEERTYTFDLLAYHFMNPGKRAYVALEFISTAKGTGKTDLCTRVARLYGKETMHDISIADFKGAFNPQFGTEMVLVCDDAAQEYGKDLQELGGKLKNLIAAESTTVNKKYQAPYKAKMNWLLLFTTNHQGTLPHGELYGRVYQVRCAGISQKRHENATFLTELYKPWCSEAQDSFFAYYLATRQLTTNVGHKSSAPIQLTLEAVAANEEASTNEHGFLEWVQDKAKTQGTVSGIGLDKEPRVPNPCPGSTFSALVSEYLGKPVGQCSFFLGKLAMSEYFTRKRTMTGIFWTWEPDIDF